MLLESNFVPEFKDDELSMDYYVGSKRTLSSNDSFSLDDERSFSKRSIHSLTPSAAYCDDNELSADIAAALLPKRPRQYRDRKVKLAVRVLKSDIRRSYPQIMINLCNMNDEILFYRFLTTYAVPNLYSLQENGSPENAIIGYSIEDMISTINTNMTLYPDRITSLRSTQLRRRSDTDQSLLQMRSMMKYTDLQTMQRKEQFMSMLIVMNKDNRIVAMYCSGECVDPVQADEIAEARINLIWNA